MNRNVSSNIGFVNPIATTASGAGGIRVRSYVPPNRSIQTVSPLPASAVSSPPSVTSINIRGNDLVLQRRRQQQEQTPTTPPPPSSLSLSQRQLQEEQEQQAAQLLYISGPDSMYIVFYCRY